MVSLKVTKVDYKRWPLDHAGNVVSWFTETTYSDVIGQGPVIFIVMGAVLCCREEDYVEHVQSHDDLLEIAEIRRLLRQSHRAFWGTFVKDEGEGGMAYLNQGEYGVMFREKKTSEAFDEKIIRDYYTGSDTPDTAAFEPGVKEALDAFTPVWERFLRLCHKWFPILMRYDIRVGHDVKSVTINANRVSQHRELEHIIAHDCGLRARAIFQLYSNYLPQCNTDRGWWGSTSLLWNKLVSAESYASRPDTSLRSLLNMCDYLL